MNRNELKQEVLKIVNTPPPANLEEAFMDAPDTFRAAKKRAQTQQIGYKIPGFSRLSEACGGLRPHGFSVICGPTGCGKTTLLANLWIKFTEAGLPVFTAPVENGKEDFMDMLVSIASGKNRLEMTHSDWEEVTTTHARRLFSNAQNVFSNHESRVNHIDLLTDIYYAWRTKGVKIALCDNWQFMLDLRRGGDALFESDKALHECVVFTKHVPVHIFMVMHPRKTEGGRVDSEYDIKGSSTSVQEAHNIWLFNRLASAKDIPDGPLFGMIPEFMREIKVAKARYNGRSYGTKIIYSLDAACEAYKEYKSV